MRIQPSEVSEQLANLFYAIAEDQQIKPIEDGLLKQLISLNAMPTKQDPKLISVATHDIILALDALEGAKITGDKALKNFFGFREKHPEAFTPELKKWILEICDKIVALLSGAGHESNHKTLKAIQASLQS